MPDEIKFSELCKFQPKQLEAAEAAGKFTYLLYGGAAGGGKIVSNNSKLLTPFGFKFLSELKVGSLINNPDGSVQRIIQIKPEVTLEKYTVRFTDGTSLEVARDHLWLAWKNHSRKVKNQRMFGEDAAEVVETQELINWLNRGYTPMIPVCVEQRFNVTHRWDKIDPYLLGLLLGDGTITNKGILITAHFNDIPHYLSEIGNEDITVGKNNFRFIGDRRKRLVKLLQRDKLFGTKSDTKFVPMIYKYSSVEDRYAVIQGLMDTDGYSAPNKNACYYYSTSKQLSNDVAFILRSLGAVVTITTAIGSYKNAKGKKIICKKFYKLYIKHRNPNTLFLLKRKKHGFDKSSIFKAVSGIEVGGVVTGRCITVSNPNGLYVTDDFIVTHNSYFLRWYAVRLLLYFAGKYGLRGVRVGLFCEDYPALKERQLSKIPYEFPNWLGTLNKAEHEFQLAPRWGNGIIAFRNLDDPSKYLSSEFASILVDELSKNQRETFDFLNMRRRWPGIPDTKFIGATNPGGIGHGWVKKLWITKDFSDEEYSPNDFGFVQAKARDNKYLGIQYERDILSKLPLALRKAYRDGDWDIFAGQYFTEFRRAVHVCDSFEIPSGWKRIRCMDYGQVKPSAVYWLAIDYDGKVYVYRELHEAGHTYSSLAKKIVEMTPEEEEIDYTIADTSMFAKTSDTGKDGDDIMYENGVPITAANKERILGWNLVREYLRKDMIAFFPNCIKAIETIPALVYKDGSEDLDTDSDDHCLVGETLIDTVHGQKRIDKLVGEIGFCYTPFGIKQFINVRKIGKNMTYRVKFKNREVIATNRHKFLTNHGWKMLKDLWVGDKVLDNRSGELIQLAMWKLKSYLRQFRNLVVRDIIFAVSTSKGTELDYTGWYGNRLIDKSRKDFMSTIKTIIGRIIPLKTLSCCPNLNIYRYMVERGRQERDQGEILRRRDLSQFNGISQARVVNSTNISGKSHGKLKFGVKKFALFVKKNIQRPFLKGLNTVIQTVKLKHYASVESISKYKTTDVYDMEVPDVHCFSSNGIVVHNSADAIRYGLMSCPPLSEHIKEGTKNPYENDPDSPWHEQGEASYTEIYTNFKK